MNRRRFLLSASAALGAAVALVYGPLIPGREFEQFVAAKLGVGEALASAMLERARSSYGAADYGLHAAAFALAFRSPGEALVPSGAKRAAAESLLEPMFSAQAASLAYAEDSADPITTVCAGLIPVR